MRCLHERLILSFSHIVSNSSRKICVGFSAANLVNKIRSIGCWQNFICSRLAILQFSLCSNELTINGEGKYIPLQREKEGKCSEICRNGFAVDFFFFFFFFSLRLVRCKITQGTLYLPIFFPPCFLPLIYSSNKHKIPGIYSEIFK